ncbi:RAxF-45 family protein [Viridibacillus sp. NPDC096237]
MKNVVDAYVYNLEFLPITCAISFDFANKGISAPIFQQNQINHS